jgi:hypothetical protein
MPSPSPLMRSRDPHPLSFDLLSGRAHDVLDAARSRDWKATSATVQRMTRVRSTFRLGEVIAVDLALDALARRARLDADPALTTLASFAQAVDGCAAALMMRAATATPPSAHPTQTDLASGHGVYADSATADPTRAVPADPTEGPPHTGGQP